MELYFMFRLLIVESQIHYHEIFIKSHIQCFVLFYVYIESESWFTSM